MTTLPIVTGSETPILRTKAVAIPRMTTAVRSLIADMEETVAAAHGVGLAAPQVGRRERVCLAMIDGIMTPLVNPEITWKSEETDVAEEGCLSLPGVWRMVRRPVSIILHYLPVRGKPRSVKLTGFSARVVQHEVDHLDGILITDYGTL